MTRTPTPPPEPPIGTQEGLEGRRCYTCGQGGHLARSCPGGRDVSMPSTYADEGRRRPCMLATCWAQGAGGTPTIPARVMNRDTQALLDTGSVVTLLCPDLAGGKEGDPMEVACVHGDTRTYETCHVVVRTPYGVFTARAGIVPHLPVPLLIGRDCPIFHRLWNPERDTRHRREPPRRAGRMARPAYGATRRPTTPGESTAEDQGTEGNGPSPPGSPIHTAGRTDHSGSQGSPPGTTDTLTASEQGVPPEEPESSPPYRALGFSSGRGGRNDSAGAVPQRSSPGRRPETRLEPRARPQRPGPGLGHTDPDVRVSTPGRRQDGGRGDAVRGVRHPTAEDGRRPPGPRAVGAAAARGVRGADPLRGGQQGGRHRLVPPGVRPGRHALDRDLLVRAGAAALRVLRAAGGPRHVPRHGARGGSTGARWQDGQDVPGRPDLPHGPALRRGLVKTPLDHRPGRENANADAWSRRDACLGWTPDDQRLQPAVKVCGNPLPTRGSRGLVVDGVYHRHPLAGGREPIQTRPNQPDGAHLAGRLKRRPETQARKRQTRRRTRRSSTHPSTRVSRRP